MKTTQKVDGTRRIDQIPEDLVRSLKRPVTGPEDCREPDDVQTESPGRYIQLEFEFERGPDSSSTSNDNGPESAKESPAN